MQLNEMTATDGDTSADDDHRPAVEREASVISLTDSVISLTDSDVSLTHSAGDTPIDRGSPMELEDGVSDYEGSLAYPESDNADDEEVGDGRSVKRGYAVEYDADYDGSVDGQESVMAYEGSAEGRKARRRASAKIGYAVEYDTDHDSSVDDQDSVFEYGSTVDGRGTPIDYERSAEEFNRLYEGMDL